MSELERKAAYQSGYEVGLETGAFKARAEIVAKLRERAMRLDSEAATSEWPQMRERLSFMANDARTDAAWIEAGCPS